MPVGAGGGSRRRVRSDGGSGQAGWRTGHEAEDDAKIGSDQGREGGHARCEISSSLLKWLVSPYRPAVSERAAAASAMACVRGQLGRSQAVRQRILIPPFGGSIPPAPASSIYPLDLSAKPARGRRARARRSRSNPHLETAGVENAAEQTFDIFEHFPVMAIAVALEQQAGDRLVEAEYLAFLRRRRRSFDRLFGIGERGAAIGKLGVDGFRDVAVEQARRRRDVVSGHLVRQRNAVAITDADELENPRVRGQPEDRRDRAVAGDLSFQDFRGWHAADLAICAGAKSFVRRIGRILREACDDRSVAGSGELAACRQRAMAAAMDRIDISRPR